VTQPDPEIHKLVEEARGGDRAAFDALIDAHQARLRARVESWMQFRIGPPLDVDEILQDTFLRAFRSLDKCEWRGGAAFFGWLASLARHALSDAIRRTQQQSLRNPGVISVSGLPAGDPTASRVARREERFDRLEDALRQLPPDYLEVLHLARIEGLTLKEIAARMDRTPNAVKHLLSRAVQELKKRFGDTESFHLPDRRLDVEGGRDGR
jgi:RNA polymerase sigma-70 factor (ECF subfamily)